MDSHRAAQLLGRRVGVSVGQRQFAYGVGEGGDRVGVAGLGGDLRERLRVVVGLLQGAAAGAEHRAEAQPLDGVVVVLAGLPAGQKRPAGLGCGVVLALGGIHARQRRRRVDGRVEVPEPRGRGQRRGEQPAGGGQPALQPVDRPHETLRHPDRRARVDQVPAEPQGLGPLPALAQHVDQAGHAGHVGPFRARRAELEGAIEHLAGRGVVAGRRRAPCSGADRGRPTPR